MNDELKRIRLLRQKQVLELLPMAKSTFWAKVNEGIIPKPIKPFGPGMSYWRYEDIEKYAKQTPVE